MYKSIGENSHPKDGEVVVVRDGQGLHERAHHGDEERMRNKRRILVEEPVPIHDQPTTQHQHHKRDHNERQQAEPRLRRIPPQRLVPLEMGTEEGGKSIAKGNREDAENGLQTLPEEERGQRDANAVVTGAEGQFARRTRATHRVRHERRVEEALPQHPEDNGEQQRNYTLISHYQNN